MIPATTKGGISLNRVIDAVWPQATETDRRKIHDRLRPWGGSYLERLASVAEKNPEEAQRIIIAKLEGTP